MAKTLHPILAFGALHIHWQLLNECVRECAYCNVSRKESDCVFMRERLLKMAERVLERPRPFYAFTFTGGEPALHPFLPDLARSILSSGRSASVTIETTGAAGKEYYDKLLKGLPGKSLRLSLATHPDWNETEKVEEFLQTAKAHGQLFHLRMMVDPEKDATQASAFLGSLLSRHPDITTEIRRLPDFREVSFPGLPQTQTPDLKLAANVCFAIERKATQSQPVAGSWCVQGANFLYIRPDGHFAGSTCSRISSPMPLWHESASLDIERIDTCGPDACSGGIDNLIPKFESREAAEAFLRDYVTQRIVWEYDAPFRNPKKSPAALDSREITRARLKRYLREAAGKPAARPGMENLGPLRHNDLTTIFERLGDDRSRETFLKAVAAVQTGTELADIPADASVRPVNENHVIRGERTLEDLKELAPLLSFQWPDLDIQLPLNGAEFLDSLLWLLHEYPRHSFHLHAQDALVHLRATLAAAPWPGPDPDSAREVEPLFSVIIVCKDAQEVIGSTLDSILVQKTDDLEIIIVDQGSSDATWDIIEMRRKSAPEIFATARIEEKREENLAAELAYEHARGKYLLFLQPGEILGANFLADAAAYCDSSPADILAAATALLEQDQETVVRLEAGENMLEVFLKAWSSGYSLASCLVKTSFARERHLRPMAAQGDYGLHLGAQLFAASPSLDHVEGIGVATALPLALPPSSNAVSLLINTLEYLKRLAAEFQLPPPLLNKCQQWASRLFLDQALGQINSDRNASQEIGRLASHPAVMDNLLANSARQFCEERHLAPEISADGWQAEDELAQQANIEPYGNAEYPLVNKPLLSIIYYNHNGIETLAQSLETVLGQNMDNYELIIVDDNSDDGSWELLQDYSDLNPRIRLYHASSRAGRGRLGNFAFERVRGQYLIAMDPDDLLKPGLLEKALRGALANKPDLSIYTLQHALPDGTPTWRQFILNGRKTSEEAWHLYETGELHADSPVIFYKTGFARAAGCEFGNSVERAQDYFFAKALSNASRIITWDEIGAQKIVEQEYNLPQAKIGQRQIRSALQLQAFLAKLIGRAPYGQLSIAGTAFKNMFLPSIHAYYTASGAVPLLPEDYQLLSENVAGELIMDYSSRNEWELSRPIRPATPAAAEARIPLVSVIWKGEAEDLKRNYQNFSGQSLRDWELLLPDGALASEIADPRIVPASDGRNGRAEYINFADYGSYLEPGDLLRAAAILERQKDLDCVCFMEASPFRKNAKPGDYAGRDLLALHLDENTAPVHWQACVFRKSFLEENGIDFIGSAADGEIFMLAALLAAAKIRLLIPEKEHGRRLRFRPGPDAAARMRNIASELAEYFAATPQLAGANYNDLILKLMDECNLKPVMAHEFARTNMQEGRNQA